METRQRIHHCETEQRQPMLPRQKQHGGLFYGPGLDNVGARPGGPLLSSDVVKAVKDLEKRGLKWALAVSTKDGRPRWVGLWQRGRGGTDRLVNLGNDALVNLGELRLVGGKLGVKVAGDVL